MPSTLVHVALALLIAAALLGEEFDGRSALVVTAATVLPDLDVALEPILSGAHRSVGHTLLFPAALFALLWWDARRGADSIVRQRYGNRGLRVAFVAVGCLFGAAIVPDLVVGGVNAFYPLHDTFYTVDGRLFYSTDRGWVQTFVDLSPPETESRRTTENFAFRTVLDVEPTLGVETASGDGSSGSGQPQRVERIFPVAMTGFRAWLLPLSAFVTAVRLWQTRRATGAGADAEE
ncbi:MULTISPECIES: metal-dependent hydrolase [Halobellus]|uniref:metal-dependent hydrolase n=1 Tax=Halobellus TaxID=1073986 RepID=UPI00210CE748|nr:metal-dependent hydrolase [Halobellus sp. H-GB7]MDQ2054721.1 metal-dependent hydrolase [Halobellus sp. H-GB7]